MLQIIFKNLDRSELVNEAINQRLQTVLERFPDLQNNRISMTLEMHNSPQQAGPDLFEVTMQVHSGRYRGVRLSKSSSHLYKALADLIENTQETLNRFGDRSRARRRSPSPIYVAPAGLAETDDDFYDLDFLSIHEAPRTRMGS